MRAFVLGLIVATGCGTYFQETPINAPPRPLPPRAPETVEVYTSGAPPRPHVDVAYFEVSQLPYGFDNTPQLVAELRRQAAEQGCDGIVVSGVTYGPDAAKEVVATCIAYTDIVWSAEEAQRACVAMRSAAYKRAKNTSDLIERRRIVARTWRCDGMVARR